MHFVLRMKWTNWPTASNDASSNCTSWAAETDPTKSLYPKYCILADDLVLVNANIFPGHREYPFWNESTFLTICLEKLTEHHRKIVHLPACQKRLILRSILIYQQLFCSLPKADFSAQRVSFRSKNFSVLELRFLFLMEQILFAVNIHLV